MYTNTSALVDQGGWLFNLWDVMSKQNTRSSIERRFVMSILWVGVIPMMLALLIGYFAAREGQQLAVMQNLLTAARKTVEGVRLVIQERERITVRVAQSPEVVALLQAHERGESVSDTAVRDRFQLEREASKTLNSRYFLFDRRGTSLITPKGMGAPFVAGLTRIDSPQFVNLQYIEEQHRYEALLVAPVRDPEDNATIGFLAESQNIHDLLALVLEDRTAVLQRQRDWYEIVIYGGGFQFVVHLDAASDEELPPPTISSIDPKLMERLDRYPDRDADTFLLWNYSSRGVTLPVLMAYRRLSPELPVYIVVHRPTPVVFRTINLAAGATLIASTLLIGVFCAVAYRIVNNTIIRPVSLLNEGAQIIRQGDLELKLKVDTGDEIEELASSFNQMSATLRANMSRLRDSEEKYRSLVTSMRDGIFQTDADDTITFINPAGVNILGYNHIQAVLGRNLSSFFADTTEFEHVANVLADQPYIENTRVWLQRPDQQIICVELTGNRLFDAEGELSGIEGSFRDVTRNVRLEQEVAERAERIATVNQIANVVNASVEAGLVYENLTREVRRLIAFDYAAAALRIEDGSFETRQLFPEAREGMALFPRMDGEDSCAAWVARERRRLLVKDLKTEHQEFSFQFPDNIESCLCVPLYAETVIIGTLNFGADTPGAFTEHEAEVLEQMAPHLAAAIRNATLLEELKRSLNEVTQARERLHAANEELKSLDEMKTNLLSNVSHELRTPLVAVMGYTDMILNEKGGPINDLQREYLRIILRNVEKLVSLIENLLDFSRLHSGVEELVFTRFDLLDSLRASMQSIEPMAESRSIELHLCVHDASGNEVETPVIVEGDKGKLGQVFNNLLSNAVKFNTNDGSVTVEIELRGDTVHVAVTDTGIGIPEDELDRVFARFYQCDSSSTRKYSGAGIGLAIAQDIVRMHGSRITVTSKVGEGSTFRFALPVHVPSEPGARGPDMPLPIETHLLIELVTQDRSLGTQMRQVLFSEGMDIIHAAYPDAAIALAQRYNPDCIIVDTESGPMGSVLLDEILNEPVTPAAPVILVTDDDALYQHYQHRVSARIKRSFRRSTLLSGIQYALSQESAPSAHLGSKILCVDDEREVTTFIARCLENEGYVVDVCYSGEEAVQLAEKGDYWLVLLDVAMPGMDGWETCRRIKAITRLAGIKVYFVTAKPVDKQPAEIRDCGADGYLLKPFKADDILSVVRTFETQS